tara:strand:- start:43 stop:543 length:501 start_codon:yes stop_codon:yes gene_type:complete
MTNKQEQQGPPYATMDTVLNQQRGGNRLPKEVLDGTVSYEEYEKSQRKVATVNFGDFTDDMSPRETRRVQTKLVRLGFDLGDTGPLKNGVDGKWRMPDGGISKSQRAWLEYTSMRGMASDEVIYRRKFSKGKAPEMNNEQWGDYIRTGRLPKPKIEDSIIDTLKKY